jgi:glutamate-1-semialdehyde aminotransferase/predicted aldo/keto reductase-like oxidoreductase
MERRRVGRTDIELSVVGLGTAQLQMLPRRQAVDTLRRGFARGINWVHNAPDYGEIDRWVAQAVRESRRRIAVLSHGPGPLDLLEAFFENTCRLHGTRRLEMYGLGCVEHLERIGENVWGPGGMVEFLQRKKAEGRLGGLFCTTHGSAEYVAGLVRSGVWDAIMLAYNPLGFHVVSYDGSGLGHDFDDMANVRAEVFPLAAERGVSLLIMKALGGGLLSRGKGFPPYEWLAAPEPPLAAGELIRYALAQPAVCAVAVGVTSPEEAEENARAGQAPVELPAARLEAIERSAARMRATLCSHCGKCESTCSRSLPISFMFRDAHIWNYRTHAIQADDTYDYHRLHPDATLACATCTDRTCVCPAGIDIPAALTRAHAQVAKLVGLRQHPGPIESRPQRLALPHRVLPVISDVPGRLAPGATGVATFILENAGEQVWIARDFTLEPDAGMAVRVLAGTHVCAEVPLRQNVSPDQRSGVAVEFTAPLECGTYDLRCTLAPLARRDGFSPDETTFYSAPLSVEGERPRRRSTIERGVGFVRRRVSAAMLRTRRSLAPPRAESAPSAPPSPEQRAYAAQYLAHTIPAHLRAGVTCGYALTLLNAGTRVWSSSPDGSSITLQIRIDGALYSNLNFPQPVHPGGETTIHFALRAPSAPGTHTLHIEPAHATEGLFSAHGERPLLLDVIVEPSPVTPTVRASELALEHNLWYYQPTQGIQYSRDGRPFPLFISRAKGARVWDPEGHEYLDYTMSWGATLLGHADDRIQAAIRERLDSGPLPPFPDPMEMEVSRLLVEEFPSAEMVVFGKNGSDVCTVASRLARLYTGKRVILSCGFHGWQDFALDYFDFHGSGIPKGPDRVLHKYLFEDVDGFMQVYEANRSDLAAVMVEPAGPYHGPHRGVEGNANREFLQMLADAARRAGALLIFDEIITGFRYPGGGNVQRATGVIPDLTCLGKALASGMPLAALVGRSEIFHRGFALTHYCPTFKEEVYSLAAARAAIEIYRTEPVAQYVWDYGERLRAGIHAICADLDLAAECKGPPFRMGLLFREADPAIFQLKRTLYVQELLKAGIITAYELMLPSYAHDERTLAETLRRMRDVLTVVRHAERHGTYHRDIEIPLL